MAHTFATVLKQAREVRGLSAVGLAREAGISAAYLSRLENGAVKRPSPHVLLQLSEVLAVPYAELMRLSGYRVPGDSEDRTAAAADAVGAALFADVTEDERDELLEYLAWYRARQRSSHRDSRAT